MGSVKRGDVKAKRGISPLIATVLLIGFTIAVILLVMLWGKNYIEELAAKKGALAEKQQECQNVEIGVRSASMEAGQNMVAIIENKKDKAVDKFIFKGLTDDNSEIVESFDKLGGLEIKEYQARFGMNGINKVSIIPSLKAGKNKYVACTDKYVTVKLG